MKLQSLRRADDGVHKYVATFLQDSGREKQVKFGAAGMSDYTIHHDPERRRRYLERHRGSEDWAKPDTAGALSRWILWGPSTSFKENVDLFKRRFRV